VDKGIIQDVVAAMASADKKDPAFLKKESFYKAVIISCKAAINFAHRYAVKARILAEQASPVRKKELLKIAEICEKYLKMVQVISMKPASHSGLPMPLFNLNPTGILSPQRVSISTCTLTEKDSSLSEEQAQELLDCLWLKFNDVNKVRDEGSTKGFGGYPMFQNLIVGGQTSGGQDATNRLSFMAMTATAHVRLHEPSLSVRVWSKSPDDLLLKACEVSRLGMGIPAYYNDEVVIPALINRGLTLEDAREYGIIGCVEPQRPGKTEGWHDAAFYNMSKVLEITLNNGAAGINNSAPKLVSWSRSRVLKTSLKLIVNRTNILSIISQWPITVLTSLIWNGPCRSCPVWWMTVSVEVKVFRKAAPIITSRVRKVSALPMWATR
jgi:formate C-acetyltransferase